MFKYILIVALGALALALGWIVFQGKAIDTLEADNARLIRNERVMQTQIKQAKQAAAISADVAQRERAMNAEASAKIEAIRNLNLGECADAQIGPDLSDIIGGR